MIVLGFVEGSEITIISQMQGNVIVKIKDTRIAISKSMASRIMDFYLQWVTKWCNFSK